MLALSIVIPTLNEGDNLRRTLYQLRATVPPETEIIVVDDGATDGCCDFLHDEGDDVRLLPATGQRLGASGARNRGAAAAGGDVLVFIDAHVGLPPGWIERLRDAACEPGVGAVAPAISVMGRPDCCAWGMRYRDTELGIEWLPAPGSHGPVAVPLVPGCCVAIRRAVFESCGRFDPGFRQWGSEDDELSLRLWTMGYELRIVPDVIVAHLFRERHPYPIDWTSIVHNKLRVAFVHFGPARLARVVERLKHFADFASACALLAGSDVNERRATVQASRRIDDDGYFARFGDIH